MVTETADTTAKTPRKRRPETERGFVMALARAIVATSQEEGETKPSVEDRKSAWDAQKDQATRRANLMFTRLKRLGYSVAKSDEAPPRRAKGAAKQQEVERAAT